MAGERFRVRVDGDVELTIVCSGNLSDAWTAIADYVPANSWRIGDRHAVEVLDGGLIGQRAEATIEPSGGRALITGTKPFRW